MFIELFKKQFILFIPADNNFKYKLISVKIKGGYFGMKITDVRVRKLTEEGKMKCIVSITFDNLFVVHDIKVIEGHNGLFIAMPSRKVGEGNFRDIAHPINAEMRQVLEDAVLQAYHEALVQWEVAAE